MKKIIIAALLLLPFIAFGEEAADGKTLFKQNCKACHNIDQSLVGPALKGVNTRRDSTWLYQFIKSSQTVIKSGDATATALFADYNQVIMPDQTISHEAIGKILAYIKAESTPKKAGASTGNPIERPIVDYGVVYRPLHFSDFFFWIVFTIIVVVFIVVFYYLTWITDLEKNAKS